MIVEIKSNNVVDPANEGKLIYLRGRIEVNEPLTEPEYGVTISAVKLKRRVQMYQWVETNDEPSSWWGITMEEVSPLSYTTTWKDKLVDSSRFLEPIGHANPKLFPMESGVSVSEIVKIGAFTLSEELKEHFNTFVLLTSDQRPDRRDIKMHSGLYYHSFDVWNPEVGDTRVQLSYAGANDDEVTIVARQVDGSLQPFYIDSKDLTTVLEGEHSLSSVLASTLPSSGVWFIRFPVYFAVYCAFSSLISVFYKLEKRSRALYTLVNCKKSFFCHSLAAAIICVVFGVTRLSYSPFLASISLLSSFILILYCAFKCYSLNNYYSR